jgi:hypothetical protein
MPRLLSFDGSGGCHSSAGCAVLGLPVRLSVNQGCCTGCNVAGAVDGVPAKHTEIPSPSRNRSQVSSPAIITTNKPCDRPVTQCADSEPHPKCGRCAG